MSRAAAKIDTQTYIRYLRELPRYNMVNELEASSNAELVEVAKAMHVELNDLYGKPRSKGVLSALIYRDIVKGHTE